ncbi:hypothetical protein [Acidovorax sp. JHL-3]|uniref:hypothetical protein n=1 Tax=Acidovorax sp. JHL-3 TaxID=1276755 RepID=UPI00138AAFC4|nr:hypothetical protein [Acidovorax sp. JHL-3]
MDIRAESQGIWHPLGHLTTLLTVHLYYGGQSGDFGGYAAYLGYYDVEGRMYGSVWLPQLSPELDDL